MAYGSPSGGDNPRHLDKEQDIIDSIPNYAPPGERPKLLPTYIILDQVTKLVGAMTPGLRKYIFPALIFGITYILLPESYRV